MTAALQPLGPAALPRFLARSAAGAAAGCAAVHGLALAAAPHPGQAVTAVLVAVCLACAVHLVRHPGRTAWGLHVVLTTAMLITHPPVFTAHHPAAGLAVWAGPVAGALAVAALLLAGVRGGSALRRLRRLTLPARHEAGNCRTPNVCSMHDTGRHRALSAGG
jgi:hypothetical protein